MTLETVAQALDISDIKSASTHYGREFGDMGIHEFVNWKLVRTHDIHAPE